MMEPLWTPPPKCPWSQAPGVGARTGLEANLVKGPMDHWLPANISMTSGWSLGKSPHQRSMLKEYSSHCFFLSALGNCQAKVPSARWGFALAGACCAEANEGEARSANEAPAACRKVLRLGNDRSACFGKWLLALIFVPFPIASVLVSGARDHY